MALDLDGLNIEVRKFWKLLSDKSFYKRERDENGFDFLGHKDTLDLKLYLILINKNLSFQAHRNDVLLVFF